MASPTTVQIGQSCHMKCTPQLLDGPLPTFPSGVPGPRGATPRSMRGAPPVHTTVTPTALDRLTLSLPWAPHPRQDISTPRSTAALRLAQTSLRGGHSPPEPVADRIPGLLLGARPILFWKSAPPIPFHPCSPASPLPSPPLATPDLRSPCWREERVGGEGGRERNGEGVGWVWVYHGHGVPKQRCSALQAAAGSPPAAATVGHTHREGRYKQEKERPSRDGQGMRMGSPAN